ncbi:MAG: winged helix DNA-binding protein [Pseudomonadota bacterium]
MPAKKKSSKSGGDVLHRHWELGRTEHDIALTEFEWSVLRFMNAFERCILQMANMSGQHNLNVQEVLFLHVVSMQKMPQTSASLAHQLNRDDIANIQYTLRKLVSAGLVEKRKEPQGKIYTFSVTEEGMKLVRSYANVRELLLADKTQFIDNVDERLDSSRRFVSLLTGVYDEVARESPTYTAP